MIKAMFRIVCDSKDNIIIIFRNKRRIPFKNTHNRFSLFHFTLLDDIIYMFREERERERDAHNKKHFWNSKLLTPQKNISNFTNVKIIILFEMYVLLLKVFDSIGKCYYVAIFFLLQLLNSEFFQLLE